MTRRPKTRPKNSVPLDYEFGELDIYNLHTEWVKQDKMIGYYGRILAKARLDYEHAKTASQVFEAETARRIRRKPKAYSLSRLTEAAIKEAVSVELLTSTSHDAVIKAKYRVELLEVAMKRLEHRRRALTDCVFLHSQQYYGTQPAKKIKSRNIEKDVRGLRDDED